MELAFGTLVDVIITYQNQYKPNFVRRQTVRVLDADDSSGEVGGLNSRRSNYYQKVFFLVVYSLREMREKGESEHDREENCSWRVWAKCPDGVGRIRAGWERVKVSVVLDDLCIGTDLRMYQPF